MLLKKPAWVLADEATSALDEDAEATLYQRLVSQVKERGGAIVSIAHRSTLGAFHDRRWQFRAARAQGDGDAGQPAFRLEDGAASPAAPLAST